MINPGMLGISQQQMEMAREVGRHLKMEIKRYHREGKLEIKYIPLNPDDNVDLTSIVNQLSEQLMHGHSAFFGMKGTIVDVD